MKLIALAAARYNTDNPIATILLPFCHDLLTLDPTVFAEVHKVPGFRIMENIC